MPTTPTGSKAILRSVEFICSVAVPLPLVIWDVSHVDNGGVCPHAPRSRSPSLHCGDVPRTKVDGPAICHSAAMIFQSLVLLPFLGVLEVHGYIPARASNVTVQGSGEVNNYGLHLQWYTNG